MHLPTLFCCACGLSLAASAQSLTIGPNGSQLSDDGVRVLAPDPIRVGDELAMHELPVSQGPALFFLNFGTSGRAGPFELADGATVGSKQSPYTLRMADHGLRFTLSSERDKQAVFGPFTATNGAPVQLGSTFMTVVRPPPKLLVSIDHPRRIAQMPAVGIAPYTPATEQKLYDLRAKFVGLANRVNADAADIQLEGVPHIRNNITGSTYSPIIKRSAADKQSSAKSAENSALTFLDKLFSEAFRIRSQAITDGLTFHFQLPAAGDYLLCATQRVKAPGATSVVGSCTAVWWTTLHFDGERPLSLALTADNAITWREVFALGDAR
jgi:hypothetical protein